MKAERLKLKQGFVSVIVTLESQEEVDSLYVIGNHCTIGNVLPALDRWYRQLAPFNSCNTTELWNRLNAVMR